MPPASAAPPGFSAVSHRPLAAGLAVSTQENTYVLECLLGKGGEATVWRASNKQSGEPVAIKFYPASPVPLPEVRREAAAMRQQHPNLVRLLDVGETDQHQGFLVLEYIPGQDARMLLDGGAIGVEEALEIGRQLFMALDALHRAGMVHGDIKPENIRLSDPGIKGRQVRVVDFGRTRLTHIRGQDGIFPGTRPYMMPSLHRAGGTPGVRSDCFAAWVTIFELITGQRPYTRTTLAAVTDDTLPPRAVCAPEAVAPLLLAGLNGKFVTARQCEVALWRALHQHFDLPTQPIDTPQVPAAQVASVVTSLTEGNSVALVGPAEQGRVMLESIDRLWRQRGGVSLWARAEWMPPGTPLRAALGLALQIGEILGPTDQLQVARKLGGMGRVLAEHVPAVRAWLPATTAVPSQRPVYEQLLVALRRLIEATPAPRLVLAERLDAADGASRRFLSTLVAEGELTVVASARPGRPHGLPNEERISWSHPVHPPVSRNVIPAPLVTLWSQARVLQLPFGTLLAQATGRTESEVEALAMDCEAYGLARWNGVEQVTVESGESLDLELAPLWRKEAASRLRDPILVAEYARSCGDRDRLYAVLDEAIARVRATDPALALELALERNSPTVAQLLDAASLALLARQPSSARQILHQLQQASQDKKMSASQVIELQISLLELEADILMHQGKTALALDTARRAMDLCQGTLHFPVLHDLMALARIRAHRPLAPQPDGLWARRFERLHDLHFLTDNQGMLYLHSRWLQHAPASWRARAMGVIWRSAMAMPEEAAELERSLLEEGAEDADPTGSATVLMHRGIARLWRGEVSEAFSDGIDASERLLHVGDPYLAALATTVVTVSGFHLGSAPTIRRIARELEGLGRTVADDRALEWARGHHAVAAWIEGNLQEAIEKCQAWTQAAAAREENTEAVAQRFYGEILLDMGRLDEAQAAFRRCDAVSRRFHLLLDYTAASVIGWTILSARRQQAGLAPLPGAAQRAWQRYFLVKRSPRWEGRVKAAEAWGASKTEKSKLFDEALQAASRMHLDQDVAWIELQRTLSG